MPDWFLKAVVDFRCLRLINTKYHLEITSKSNFETLSSNRPFFYSVLDNVRFEKARSSGLHMSVNYSYISLILL